MPAKGLLSLKILTPEGILHKIDNLNTIIAPLADGFPLGIKPRHAPLIAETVQGTIKYRSHYREDSIELHPGVLDIRNNEVVILTAGETSEVPEETTPEVEREYNRLMQTLLQRMVPENERKID